MFNYITTNSQYFFIALSFFVILFILIFIDKVIFSKEEYSKRDTYILYSIFKNRIKNTKAFFFNDDFKNHKITYLIFFVKDNKNIAAVVLNNNFKTLHSVDIKNGVVRVHLFTFTINGEKINNNKDLISYLNNRTNFKVLAHTPI